VLQQLILLLNKIAMTLNNETIESDELNLFDLLLVVVDNLRLLVLVPLAFGILVLALTFLIPPSFTAKTVFMPPQQQSGAASMLAGLGALGGLAGAAAGIKNPTDQYIGFLKSDVIANALISRFKLKESFGLSSLEATRKELASSIEISSGKDGFIVVSVMNKDPVFAAQLANAYVEELRNLLDRIAVTDAQHRRVFFEKQIVQVKEKLAEAEQTLRSNGVNRSALKSSPEATIKLVAELQARISVQEVKLASMRGYLTENSPDFKQTLTELNALKMQFSKVENSTSTSSDGEKDGYIARLRSVKYFETMYELFAKQYELAKIDEAREGAIIQVIDDAVPPELKSSPKKAIVAILSTMGIGVLLLIYLFFRKLISNVTSNTNGNEKLIALKTSWRKALGKK
jgi:tyrosine-protein kinase Etk/Wzc